MMMVKGLITRYFGRKSTLALSSQHIEASVRWRSYAVTFVVNHHLPLLSL